MIVHIAGNWLFVGPRLRQRCAWCGAVLVDQDTRNVMVPVGQEDLPYPTWTPGGLVAVSGGATYTIEHTDGDDLPKFSCGLLDPAVTR